MLYTFSAIVIGFEEPVYTVNEGESVTVCINVTNPPVEFSLSLTGTLFLSGTHISGTASKWVELHTVVLKTCSSCYRYS